MKVLYDIVVAVLWCVVVSVRLDAKADWWNRSTCRCKRDRESDKGRYVDIYSVK
jgi:hypothetical protein